MTRTVLAATDFSDPARHALERAAQVVHTHPDARLTLAHVLDAPGLGALDRLLPDEASTLRNRLHDEARARLDGLAAQLAARWPGSIDTVLAEGAPLPTLGALAESHQAELLVMGVRGAHFMREWLIGSTTERVLRTTHRPLLAVRQRPLTPYRRILAAVDFSTHAAAAVNAAHHWFPDAEIVLLHAFEVELEPTFRLAGMADERIHDYRIRARDLAVADMETFVGSLAVPAHRLTREFVHGPAELRIVEHEQSMDADLIVMGKRGLGLIEELLLGSVTKQVLARATSDLLIVGAPVAGNSPFPGNAHPAMMGTP